ncbi:MAG TPA: signal peptidase I [Bacteroidota bacterium]|nr:signal peptidase I [Bacteroidota bacterium]
MPQQENKKTEAPIPFATKVKDFFREAAIVIIGFLLLNNFVIASFMVPTGSMENEVMTGDFLMVNKFIYGGCSPRNIPFTDIRLPWFRLPAFKSVHRGDVIVFVFPGYREEVHPEAFTYYLKRCIAVSGDTLQIINRAVYVNGKASPLPRNMKFNSPRILPPGYADDRIFPPGAPFNEDNYGPIVIPFKGMKIKITPDNLRMWDTFIQRDGHLASISPQNNILIDGAPNDTYVVQHDYLFGMGDNRDNSLDSRYWGFVPADNVVGTPMFVYWSWDTDVSIFDIFQKIASVRLGRIGTLIR